MQSFLNFSKQNKNTVSGCLTLFLRKAPDYRMAPNFNVSAPPTFVTEFSNIKLVAVVVGESVFVSCVFFF